MPQTNSKAQNQHITTEQIHSRSKQKKVLKRYLSYPWQCFLTNECKLDFRKKKMFFVAQKYWWKSKVFPNNKSVFRHQESIQKNKDWTPFFVNWHVKRASDRHHWSCVRGRHKLCSMSSHKIRYWKEKVKTCYGYIDKKTRSKNPSRSCKKGSKLVLHCTISI